MNVLLFIQLIHWKLCRCLYCFYPIIFSAKYKRPMLNYFAAVFVWKTAWWDYETIEERWNSKVKRTWRFVKKRVPTKIHIQTIDRKNVATWNNKHLNWMIYFWIYARLRNETRTLDVGVWFFEIQNLLWTCLEWKWKLSESLWYLYCTVWHGKRKRIDWRRQKYIYKYSAAWHSGNASQIMRLDVNWINKV